ncbi:hypothetical protein GGX14DRAFT_398776 [Mycena pura]|uniref:Uncharacterized protein n=1 Tax=Mycena pura TaxID=153505 RepID=A0AAD6V5W3_9AGAR|nr:hypothetical protein GGX14DRAFT_398776 [Mycena pura]
MAVTSSNRPVAVKARVGHLYPSHGSDGTRKTGGRGNISIFKNMADFFAAATGRFTDGCPVFDGIDEKVCLMPSRPNGLLSRQNGLQAKVIAPKSGTPPPDTSHLAQAHATFASQKCLASVT